MSSPEPEGLAIQWYRCSCGFEGERPGTRAETTHWLVWGHLRGKGEDHKVIVKTLPPQVVVVNPTGPTCMWCDRRDVVYDPANESWVCPEHTRQGPQ